MKPASLTAAYKIRTLKRGLDMGSSIIAIYHKNAKLGEMPIWMGPRKNSKAFLNSIKRD